MRRPCVMIVEDEPLVRMMLADQLSEDDFLVVEADNADTALELLSAQPQVSAVITDVRMPGTMDGLEFARRVSAAWPHLKVFVTSGHVQAGQLDLPPDAVFIPKPYPVGAFTAALNQLPS